MRKELVYVVILILILLLFVIVYATRGIVEYNWISSYGRLEKAGEIIEYLEKNYTFSTSSVFNPGHPPVSADFGTYPTIRIYTATNDVEQEKILNIIKNYMRGKNIKSVIVKFYEKENWIVKKDSSGNIAGSRGPEKLIRKVTLKL